MPYINQWAKTDKAIQIIETQKPFCLEGVLYQGFNRTIIRVKESQLSDREMSELLDIDNSMERVWVQRKQRLEGRNERKVQEYAERKAKLRSDRNEIMTSIERQQKAGLPISPADSADIDRIDKRMSRLASLEAEASIKLASRKEGECQRTEVMPSGDLRVECEFCGEKSPADHEKPKKWLTGHRMGCKHRPGSANARRGRPRKAG